jgi:hypothetical protein
MSMQRIAAISRMVGRAKVRIRLSPYKSVAAVINAQDVLLPVTLIGRSAGMAADVRIRIDFDAMKNDDRSSFKEA